jgi:transposase
VNRFSGLGPEWFWEDEFRIPTAPDRWSEENALIVAQKRVETGWSGDELAEYFGKHRDTIRRAIHLAATMDPAYASLAKRMPKPQWAELHYAEVWQLHLEGMTTRELSKHFKRSGKCISSALEIARRKFAANDAEPPSATS